MQSIQSIELHIRLCLIELVIRIRHYNNDNIRQSMGDWLATKLDYAMNIGSMTNPHQGPRNGGIEELRKCF